MRVACLSLLVVILGAAINEAVAKDDWWEYGHFYQVYPRSFQDSDDDGIGDLNGILSRLEHLKSIDVTGIWLSPIFESPMKDFGYDISNFTKIQPEYGTMDDFENLVARCKELDIKIILDFVPNHCSNEHSWFKAAIDPKHPDHEKYRDYFIWHKGKTSKDGKREPPSNWLSIFRGSAWEWNDAVGAYYLHQFLEAQPDLNFRNPAVVEEMKEVLRFWLRKGVDGFRVDAIPFIFESKENDKGYYDDEKPSGICGDDPQASCYLNHTETKDLDETYDMIYQWRRLVDEEEFNDSTKILMLEGYTTLPQTMRYYGKIEDGKIVKGQEGAQIPFNFFLLTDTWMGTGTWGYKFKIEDFLKNMPKGDKIQANWVLGNHDNKRIASKYKPTRIDLFNILSKTLPGITITYYGEEIGMTNVFISWEDTVDPQACRGKRENYENASRDPVRTPFQWNSKKNAGFSKAKKTWLPVALNYTDCNVKQQLKDKRSNLKVFQDLMKLRQNPTMKYGDIEIVPVDEEVVLYKRQIKDDPDADVIVVILNLEPHKRTIDLKKYFKDLPRRMKTAVASIHSGLQPGDKVKTNKVPVTPDVGIVLVGSS